jgi:ribose transport system substrate-binding protein
MRQIAKLTKIPALILAGLLTVSFGLGSASAEQDQVTLQGVKPFPNERYVMITFLSGIEFWVPARKGMEHAAKQLGVQAS